MSGTMIRIRTVFGPSSLIAAAILLTWSFTGGLVMASSLERRFLPHCKQNEYTRALTMHLYSDNSKCDILTRGGGLGKLTILADY